ncbi:MAG TPA: hypothetical protein VHG89_00900 [Verrucomicrobiae bacterium]|nr:hypothetical protein [Verrucomicrobiae bacterium]
MLRGLREHKPDTALLMLLSPKVLAASAVTAKFIAAAKYATSK